jgi:hypothetical protein
MNDDTAPGISSKRFVLIFVVVLAVLLIGFTWMVRWATATLPQEHEIITAPAAAERLQRGEFERILIQGEQDIFYYLPGEARPLYTQLELGETFTETMAALGVDPAQFPPLTIEADD